MPIATVALVGYTNAGKSTLFNALTKAGVLESARMFATLDPTLRQVVLPSKREVLLSDTVGFIRNLPHTLVSAFRATLEEVQRASLLLHVADVTSPTAGEQQAQVEEVLRELESQDKPRAVRHEQGRSAAGEEARDPARHRQRHSRIGSEGNWARQTAATTSTRRSPKIRCSGYICGCRNRKAGTGDCSMPRRECYAREYRDGYVDLDVQAPESLLRRMKSFVMG